MKKINVQCPKCGANLEIEPVAVAIPAIAVSFPAKDVNKAESKIEALRNAGVDVSNLFSICGKNGDYEVGRLANGRLSIVPDDDPIFAIIKKNGTIPDRRLFRRWIMAQVFHMLTETDYKSNIPIGFTAALRRKGYKYQWTMVVEEMWVQSKLNLSDPENFAERNRWFNKKVVVEMAQDYISQLKKVVKGLRVRHCKGVPYIRLGNTNIFVTDIQSKVYDQLEKALKAIKNARTPAVLSIATEKYYQLIKKIYLAYGLDQSRAFKDAYKGAGAFFTLKNLILFHDCVFLHMTQEASLAYLYQLIEPKDFEGYKLFGILKDFLKHNNIDITAKQAEWRAQSLQ